MDFIRALAFAGLGGQEERLAVSCPVTYAQFGPLQLAAASHGDPVAQLHARSVFPLNT